MNKTKLQQLEQLLNAPVVPKVMSNSEWEREGGKKHPEAGDAIQSKNAYLIVTRANGAELQCWEIAATLTPLEKQLIGWAIQQGGVRSSSGASDLERQTRRLGEWIQQSVTNGEWRAEVPDRMELRNRLFDGMVPFLLLCEQLEDKEPSYSELEKTIRTFISDETLLIPLREHEWLILSSDRLLTEADTDGDEVLGHEETKEILSTLAEGLHQLVTGEWGGECHIAVGEPIVPAESVIRIVGTLRETIFLGRKFHVGMQIHLPWLVHLERLLSGIPEQVRSRFVEEMMGRPDLFTDSETVSTLDAFFSMDCNVSETAKKLFIHRNTLLYRLDKIKNEAGLDVRSFNDAVLVRILLLLYKVTKRK
ncbi:PucR family transcriptional regulator [Cohnella endophytica]|uniref:PucR family transcriptional regulator n=1 Tax=Cohnella endophytica TaxID=2419778 RepID=A0A494XM84_9BACL|nr:helix-turn-helix domain-containing protein [Cohnella endophytica]RKP49786.1 PucR family transcriptional regulator [Cohnella endophytica]